MFQLSSTILGKIIMFGYGNYFSENTLSSEKKKKRRPWCSCCMHCWTCPWPNFGTSCRTHSAWELVFMTLFLHLYSPLVTRPIHINSFILIFTFLACFKNYFWYVSLDWDLAFHLSWYVDFISYIKGFLGLYEAWELNIDRPYTGHQCMFSHWFSWLFTLLLLQIWHDIAQVVHDRDWLYAKP